MPKLLACDMDGTLIQHNIQSISNQDLLAIKKFRDAGNIFALCTGRTLTWTLPVIEQHEMILDALILCNGSMIYTIDPNNPLKAIEVANNSIPNNIGKEILQHFYEQEHFTLYWDNGINTFELKDRLMNQVTTIVQENYSKHILIDEALTETRSFTTIGITPMSGSIEDAEKIKKYILDRWGNYVDSFRNQYFIDITPKESSKGQGITNFTNLYPVDSVYGVGDSWNDAPMFETVGKDHAFLMANGESSLEQFTKYKVKSVAECIDIILSL